MIDTYREYQRVILISSPTNMLPAPPEGFFGYFASETVSEIFNVLQDNADHLLPVTAANIPQFSSIDEVDNVLRILIDSGECFKSYNSLGYYMCPRGANTVAQSKYGENHYKLAALLGLTCMKETLSATGLGIEYHKIQDIDLKLAVRKRLAIRTPIIQQALLAADSEINVVSMMKCYLSESTVIRRKSNVKTLLQNISDVSDSEMLHRISNIVWS